MALLPFPFFLLFCAWAGPLSLGRMGVGPLVFVCDGRVGDATTVFPDEPRGFFDDFFLSAVVKRSVLVDALIVA